MLVACGASAHNGGAAHGVPQLGAGGEGDTAHADVLRGDVVFLALVAAGEGEAEGAHVVYLDAVAVEQGLGNALPHGLQHGGHIALGGRTGVVDVVGHLLGGDHATAHDAHAHRGVLLGGLAGEVVTFVQLVGNGARFLGGGSLFHLCDLQFTNLQCTIYLQLSYCAIYNYNFGYPSSLLCYIGQRGIALVANIKRSLGAFALSG